MGVMGHKRITRLDPVVLDPSEPQAHPSEPQPYPSAVNYETAAEYSPFSDVYSDSDYMMDSPMNNLMMNDSPFQGLDPTTRLKGSRPMNENELRILKSMSWDSMRISYRSDPVVQLHNKGTGQNLVVSRYTI